MEKFWLWYFLIINFYGFYLMYSDKKKAINKKWRVPEKRFFIVSLLGGSLGTFLAMNIFRHKTRHWYFKYGIPLIIVIHSVIIMYVIQVLNINLLNIFYR